MDIPMYLFSGTIIVATLFMTKVLIGDEITALIRKDVA